MATLQQFNTLDINFGDLEMNLKTAYDTLEVAYGAPIEQVEAAYLAKLEPLKNLPESPGVRNVKATLDTAYSLLSGLPPVPNIPQPVDPPINQPSFAAAPQGPPTPPAAAYNAAIAPENAAYNTPKRPYLTNTQPSADTDTTTIKKSVIASLSLLWGGVTLFLWILIMDAARLMSSMSSMSSWEANGDGSYGSSPSSGIPFGLAGAAASSTIQILLGGAISVGCLVAGIFLLTDRTYLQKIGALIVAVCAGANGLYIVYNMYAALPIAALFTAALTGGFVTLCVLTYREIQD